MIRNNRARWKNPPARGMRRKNIAEAKKETRIDLL
jgi:hypothetical protein